jgi:hypothetical protein
LPILPVLSVQSRPPEEDSRSVQSVHSQAPDCLGSVYGGEAEVEESLF